MQVTTLKQLEKVVGNGKGLWFLCIVEAKSVIDSYITKDFASLFEDGIQPMSTRWKDMLSTMGDDDVEIDDDGNTIGGGGYDDDGNCFPTVEQIEELMEEIGWKQ